MPPLIAVLCARLTSLLAATVLAVSGFGSALVSIPLLALMVPGMVAGLFLGQRMGRRLSRPQVMRLVAALLVISGTSVLWKAAAL